MKVALMLIALAVGACRAAGESPVRPPSPSPAPVALAASAARLEPAASAEPAAPALVPATAPFSATSMPDPTWVLAARRERGFRSVALEGSGAVHLVWTRGEPQDDPASSMPVARVEIVLTRDGRATRVDVGKVVGSIEPGSSTLCARLRYRAADGSALALPSIDGLVSAMSVGLMSGSDDLLVVLGGGALHVLRSQRTDGMCESQAKQGPLTVCHGEEYTRVAEVRLGPAASFEESIVETTGTGTGAIVVPLDCAAPTIEGSLLTPSGSTKE
jgi:hypothetical protein